MKLHFVLPLLLVLANVGCQSQPKSAYGAAVSNLTKKRAGSLQNFGWYVQYVNPYDGYVLAKKSSPFHSPQTDTAVLKNAPIFLATGDCVAANGQNISSVTGYWTGPR
jgi:hypothetical protein